MNIVSRLQRISTALTALHSRLIQEGYTFADPAQALPGPSPNVSASLKRIEQTVGPVPLALRRFYEVVGSVNFLGSHPEWRGCEYPDPLFVYPVEVAIVELDDYLLDPEDYCEGQGGFRLVIAPDYYHKEDVSGGMPYGVAVPAESDDPPLLEEWHHTTFLDYLETALRWGGFPGLERCPGHTWPVEALARDLF